MRLCSFIAACCLALSISCSKTESRKEVAKQGKPAVYTVNYPLKYFAQRIAGDAVDIVFPTMDGDPAYWQPTPEQVTSYQDAEMILLNGADYAKWAGKVSLPAAKMVDTGSGFADRFIKLEGHVTHSHGPGGEHAHGGFAFTTWLDPRLAIEQAQAIKDAFARKWSDRASAFESGFAALKKDLQILDKELIAITSGKSGVPLIMSHPVYQYLERRYELNARSVHWEPDVMPDDQMIADFKEMLSSHPAKWMVWEGEPMLEAVQALRDLGVESIVFDPCGNEPDQGDFLSLIRRNATALRRVYTAE